MYIWLWNIYYCFSFFSGPETFSSGRAKNSNLYRDYSKFFPQRRRAEKEQNDILKCREGEIYTVWRIYFDKEMEGKQKKASKAASTIPLFRFFYADILYFCVAFAKQEASHGKLKAIVLLNKHLAKEEAKPSLANDPGIRDKGYHFISFIHTVNDGFCILYWIWKRGLITLLFA